MRGVTDQPWAIEEIVNGYADEGGRDDADGPWSAPLLPDQHAGGGGGKDKATMSKVKNWLKVTIKGGGGAKGQSSSVVSPRPSMDTPSTIMAATPRRIDPYSLDLHRSTPMASVSEDGHEADTAGGPDEYALDQEVNIPQSASDNSFFQFEVREHC